MKNVAFKKNLKTYTALMLLACAVAVFAVFTGLSPVKANAGTLVAGTVNAKSTETLLYLDTTGGQMQIKFDDKTDFTKCPVLVSGSAVTVDVYNGGDGYLHAASVSLSKSIATVDRNKTTTVTGKIADGTTDSVLKLSTTGGMMTLKIDDTSDFSKCRILKKDKEITVFLGYGSDAYWHVLTASSAETGVQTVTTINGVNMPVVTGTVTGDSNAEYLNINTTAGAMILKLDSQTDISECGYTYKGQTVYATIYLGTDSYLHVAKLVNGSGTKDNTAYTLGGQVLTVQGKATSDTTPYMIQLSTPQGIMKIKMDGSTKMTNNKVITENVYLTIDVQGGSDGYLHALKVTRG
ncbi:MAG: hypothetical protein K6C99_02235 [Lachnospiraceae bacterium]|nr:hypothetical protein [Lachnospiraceae bacterium]